jgi:sulfur carrier protein ThiS
VTVTLEGRLAEEHAEYDGQLTLPEGAVAGDVATACGIDPRACVVVVNGSAVPRGAALSDGDRTRLYPAQAGG